MLTIALGLFAFGILYNALVSWLERNGYDEGYTAILVVGGVGITLLFVAVLDWQAALLTFLAFCSRNAPLYCLIFAGHNQTGMKIVQEVFRRYELLGR